MDLKKYNTFFFDADDTLFDFRCSEEVALQKVSATHGMGGFAEFLPF